MYQSKKVAVIIAAGGAGVRFGGNAPKQFLDVDGETMVLRAIRPFEKHPAIDEIIVVVPAGFEEQAGGFTTVLGGPDRVASVRNGLAAVPFSEGLVLIHDAARPFVTKGVIDSVLQGAAEAGAAVPCIPVTDTIYEARLSYDGAEHRPEAADILERQRLRAVQTPQGFDLARIKEAHEAAAVSGSAFTDDGSMVHATGHAVRLVEGDPANRKITRPGDLASSRVGVGFDAHRFREGGPLVLGGVEIPFEKGLDGHSDADVLTHALMDAILGALHMGDIGALFPDTDPRYQGISSMELLEKVANTMQAAGFGVGNADMTVVCEEPKIAPHRERIEESLAAAVGSRADKISVKGTTTEKLGFSGREEGIAAEAVVLLTKRY
ncbi:MAG: 2-C-methyl-D-erythritol 2,4-cyclodiphosphate synthase [Clostridiales Family XIII bacterium]|jgi:2-C-methyl-D-erythritol 2,4-cyclodiphosphate synthase/2-C-methyl-D-erythritol 4-phosphate cytidylyltransferase|nr:2-C-methyl-D-erythritol 2,4-cyclodiphosphate synthase [Clostridiales Family XIII bacterium]